MSGAIYSDEIRGLLAALYNVPAGPRAKEVISSASGSTSPTGTDGCTGDLKDQSHAKEEYDVITFTS